VLLVLWTGRRRMVLAMTAVCTGLILLGPFMKSTGTPDVVTWANQLVSIAAVWASALMGLCSPRRLCTACEELQRLNEELRDELSVHKDLEATLRRNQQRLAAAQEIAVIGSWEWELASNRISWSNELYRICGLSPEHEMTYDRFLRTIEPADRDHVVSIVELSKASGHSFRVQYRVVRPDGTRRIVQARGQPEWDPAGRMTRLHGTGQDITELREAEEGLERSQQQLRALSAHLQSVREQERTRIAREIHDELGQALTALKLDVASLARKSAGDPVIEQKTRAMVELINETIQTVRRIATELRPAILDDLGLPAALEWQTHEFQKRTGLACELKMDPDLKVAPGPSTELFRVFQETLTNIVRHARASAVTIYFGRQDDRVVLEVRDNGVGIAETQVSGLRSLGITGMRERVHLLGGDIQLTGIPGQGTTVRIQVPAEHAEQPREQLR
jgi:PAS domain S-box-containing protein